MNPDRLLAHFERLADATDAIPRLRRFILDLAVRGKLVEQDPNDEPASKLLNRIQVEKTRSAKKGRTQNARQKSDVMYADFPFEIPDNWCWTQLISIVTKLTDGTHHSPPNSAEGDFKYITAKNIKNEGVSLDNVTYVPAEIHRQIYSRCDPSLGDILYIKDGATTGIVTVNDLDEPFSMLSSVALLKLPECIFNRLLVEFLRSPFFYDQMRGFMKGAAITRVTLKRMGPALVPLPPLSEQHRIVAKVDELMALCDRLVAARNERESRHDRLVAASLHRLSQPADDQAFRADARFTLDHLPRLTARLDHVKQLRQTILNLAVRGRLVPRDPNDEPANALLERIAAHKIQLTKSGIIKRDGRLSPVDESDVPFPLPKGWAWARFSELGVFGRGKSKHRPRDDAALYQDGTHPFIQTGDVARSRGLIQSFSQQYNEMGLAQSAMWPKGTLCITIAANIADSGILDFDACFPDSVVGFIAAAEFENARYFEYFVRTAKADLLEFAPSTAQKNINLSILNTLLIPLPPLAEQHRIVARVDDLMALCDRLEANLAATETDSRRLLEAVLHEALQPAEGALEAAE